MKDLGEVKLEVRGKKILAGCMVFQCRKTKKKVKCNYCQKILNGGVYRLKQHLALKTGNVKGCTQVPKEMMLAMRKHLQQGAELKRIESRRKVMIEEGLKPRSHSEEKAFASMDDPDLDPFQREKMKMALRESVCSAKMDEEA